MPPGPVTGGSVGSIATGGALPMGGVVPTGGSVSAIVNGVGG